MPTYPTTYPTVRMYILVRIVVRRMTNSIPTGGMDVLVCANRRGLDARDG
ncbi:MAG: hypothetical protein IJ607_02195 [Bacteroidaceae bacterium]|nr:hypothetical protein [Bacteroidaceae bacterium]